MKTVYVLKLDNIKYLERLIKNGFYFINIKYYDNYCLLYVDIENYNKLKKYFKLYGISLIKIKGLDNYKYLLKKYALFLFSTFLGIMFIYYLSNVILDIKIMTNKEDLIKIINSELKENGLWKYHMVKSFEEKERIRNKILNDYKDKFEWIEIERVGTKYYVHVLERIINKKSDENIYQNIVARKNAVILEIKASSGEIIRKINDYVNKGDVIISGAIKKNDEIKNLVKAEGSVFGETWYIVKVELPRTYNELKYTGNKYQKLSLNIFDKRIFLFKNKKYNNEEYEDNIILGNNILPISLNKTIIKEVREESYFYTYQDAIEKGLTMAKEKLLANLKDGSKILLQKKLKLYEENSTIVIEVFFKVYEDITDYERINVNE